MTSISKAVSSDFQSERRACGSWTAHAYLEHAAIPDTTSQSFDGEVMIVDGATKTLSQLAKEIWGSTSVRQMVFTIDAHIGAAKGVSYTTEWEDHWVGTGQCEFDGTNFTEMALDIGGTTTTLLSSNDHLFARHTTPVWNNGVNTLLFSTSTLGTGGPHTVYADIVFTFRKRPTAFV